MHCKTLLIVGIALVALQLVVAQPVKRSCACMNKGTDVCGCNAGVIVRPSKPARVLPLAGPRVVCQKIAGVQEFKPIGDLCSCHGSYVQPALVPRIPCQCQCQQQPPAPEPEPEPDCVFNAPMYNHHVTYHHHAHVPVEIEAAEELVEEAAPCHTGPVPADAVSLALAFEMAQRCNKKIKEEALGFGPATKPIDGTIKVTKAKVPEAGLYALRNHIVELRPCSSGYGLTVDEEAEAALLAQEAAEEVADTGVGARFLSYNDLGYAPIAPGCGSTFVPGPYTPPAPQVIDTFEYQPPCANSPQPGNVVEIPCNCKHYYEHDHGYDHAYDHGDSEEVEEEVYHHQHQHAPACNCGCY